MSLFDHGGLLRHLLLQLLTALTLLLRTRLQHRTPHRSGQDEHGHKHEHEHEHEHEHQHQHEHQHEHQHQHEHEPTQLACLRTCSRAEFLALSLAFFCRCFAIAASCSAARGDCTTLSRADGGAAHAPGPHKHTSCRISYRAQN